MYIGTNLNIVATYDCNPSVYDHVLGMKCSKEWSMIIDNLEINVRDFMWATMSIEALNRPWPQQTTSKEHIDAANGVVPDLVIFSCV